MKANQKFRSGDDAVSPVIAVILMVAITVVLAATVYVWVSGFGSSSGTAASSISLTRSSSGGVVTYTVASASNGLKWSALKLTVSGASAAYQLVTSGGDASTISSTATLTPSSTSVIHAGDAIYISSSTTALSGLVLTVLDQQANSIMAKVEGGVASANSAIGATNLMSASSISRYSGTAGTLTAGSSLVTLSAPVDMGSSFVVGDLACNNAHSLGASTITKISPTQFLVNWAGDSTCVTTDTLSIGSGNINGPNGAASTGASSALLTNA